MTRRGAGLARKLEAQDTPEPELMETPALGRIVELAVAELRVLGAKSPEIASLLAHAASHLAKQGPNRLSRDEWLVLAGVLWDGPDGQDLVTAPGGQA